MAIIKYIIADDHKIFRQGLKMALSSDHKLKCVGEAGDGKELLALLEKISCDVILLDIKMPVMDGIQVIKIIRSKDQDIKIIPLTMFEDENFVLQMMKDGANGFLLKNADPDEIKIALHTSFENGYYFNDLVNATMLRSITGNHINPRFKKNIELTERELQVLKLICEEHTTTEIGDKIFLAPRTIEGIRSSLIEKIGVRNTAGLVLYASRNGIV